MNKNDLSKSEKTNKIAFFFASVLQPFADNTGKVLREFHPGAETIFIVYNMVLDYIIFNKTKEAVINRLSKNHINSEEYEDIVRLFNEAIDEFERIYKEYLQAKAN